MVQLPSQPGRPGVFLTMLNQPSLQPADAAAEAASGSSAACRALLESLPGLGSMVGNMPASMPATKYTSVPCRVRVNGKPLRVAEINFLCVHKKLRSKRLAPLLIKVLPEPANPAACHQGLSA